MKHLFIPYELAVIAKEKGFDEQCFGSYGEDSGGRIILVLRGTLSGGYFEKVCSAPLYQQIVDWFRNKHHIIVQDISGIGEKEFCFRIQQGNFTKGRTDDNYYKAFNKAIEEAFKLI